MFRMQIQSKKKCIWYCSAAVSFLLFLLLNLWCDHLVYMQDAQQMAGRWSEKKDVAQVSCFFSSKAEVTEDTIQSFEYSLKNVLQEASITETSENPSARLWVDAYSADGKITLVNGKNTLDANAIGIGGAKEKFRNNMAAINLLHELEIENRLATPEDQKILSRYVGWGGLSMAFDEHNAARAEEFKEL